MDSHARIPRREFLGGMTGLMATIAAGGCAAARGPSGSAATRGTAMYVYVGCYTTKERNARGEGVNVYRVNPSWLGLDRRQRILYSAHGDLDYATAYAIDAESGRLSVLGRQATGGKNGVRLAVDASNKFVVLANYATATVAVLPINADGTLGAVSDLVTLTGKPGPHRAEQASAHPHDVIFDPRSRFIAVPDKGLDATFVFRLDTASGKLVAADPPSVPSRPGAAPRHFDFHPSKPYAYQINELDSTLTTFAFDAERGRLEPRQTITTLPAAFTGNNTTAEIAVAPSGRFVYGSNRGHDSLAIFAVDDATGVLSPVGWEPTQGKVPRFFTLDPSGTFLYAANQNSDTIVTFRVDAARGTLKPTGQVLQTGSPCTIVFRSA